MKQLFVNDINVVPCLHYSLPNILEIFFLLLNRNKFSTYRDRNVLASLAVNHAASFCPEFTYSIWLAESICQKEQQFVLLFVRQMGVYWEQGQMLHTCMVE